MTTLTVEQLETLARRARERGADKATFYQLGHLLVEVTRGERESDGPNEAVIRENGDVE